MSDKELVKYYDGFVVEGGKEVPADTARGLPSHAKAFFKSSARTLDRVELYNRVKLSRVDYYGERKEEEVKEAHVKLYKGIGFTTRRRTTASLTLVWEYIHSYSPVGVLDGFTLVLQDNGGRGRMEVQLSADKKVQGVTKYYWEGEDELRYVFEYNQSGQLVSVYDLMYGDQASFQDLQKTLPDSGFFGRGLQLPRELAGASIPI